MYMIEKKIMKCLKLVFKNKKIPKNSKNLKLGSFPEWDSLAHLNFLLTIEKEFKIKFPLKKIYEIRSIKEIISYVSINKS